MSIVPPTVRKYVAPLIADDLFQDGSILIVAAFLTGFLNYLYQVLMGRMLGPEQYGVFGALFALSYLLLLVSRGVQLCTTRYVSRLDDQERAQFLRGFGARVAGLMVLLFIVLGAASPALAQTLRISDPMLIVVVGITLLFGPVNAVNFGALRGLQYFRAMGGGQVAVALVKLATGVAFVLFGFGVYGAVGGPAIAVAVVCLAMLYYLRSWFRADESYSSYGDVYRYVGPSLLVAFCMTIPTNADVILVKHLFTSVQTGLYTAVSVFGKVLIFLPAGITGALFPKAAKRGETRALLHRGLLYTGVLAGCGALVLMIAPRLALNVLYGQTYASAAPVLRWYAPAITAFSLCVVLLNYALAVDEHRFVKAFTALTLLEVGLAYVFGTSALRIAQVLLVVNLVGFVGGYLLFFAPSGTEGDQSGGRWST